MIQIIERSHNTTLVLTIWGRFDYMARKEFKAALKKAKDVGTKNLILDMSGVSFVDSAAIALLSFAQDYLKQNAMKLTVANPQTYVKGMLDLTRLSKYLPIVSSVDEALAI